MNLAVRLSRNRLLPVSGKISSVAYCTLCAVALRFKVSFTSADAPELLLSFPRSLLQLINDSSLVGQSRIIFVGIGVAILLSISAKIYLKLPPMTANEGMTCSRSMKRWF